MNRKKRRMSMFLCALLLISGSRCLAGEQGTDFTLYARSAVLMDGDSGRILYGKEADEELPMASTTKIMTCIVALEQAEPDLVCTVSEHASAQPQVKLGMRTGDTFYLEDLLYSLMLESHNDTAVCIAENVAGSVEAFAVWMNEKAEKIGCTDTHYVTPNGLDGEDAGGEHHTTAAELAGVLRYCITQSPKAQEFLTVTQTSNYTFMNCSGTRHYSCVNHNAFLSMMDGALTGKTGFTSKAGYCYVGALYRDNRLYIVALLACGWPNHKSYKWSDTRKLMEYGLDYFQKREVTDLSVQPPSVPVAHGKKGQVSVIVKQEPLELLMRKEEQVTSKLEMAPSLEAPVRQGDQVGILRYYLNGVEFLRCPVLSQETAERVDFAFYLSLIREKFLL